MWFWAQEYKCGDADVFEGATKMFFVSVLKTCPRCLERCEKGVQAVKQFSNGSCCLIHFSAFELSVSPASLKIWLQGSFFLFFFNNVKSGSLCRFYFPGSVTILQVKLRENRKQTKETKIKDEAKTVLKNWCQR